MTPPERIDRGKRELAELAEEHGICPTLSAGIVSALSQIGPEELGRLIFASGAVDEMRHFVDLASGALAVAERFATQREGEAGSAVLSQISPKRCKAIEESSVLAAGWGCCRCRMYNGAHRRACRGCGHERCTQEPRT